MSTNDLQATIDTMAQDIEALRRDRDAERERADALAEDIERVRIERDEISRDYDMEHYHRLAAERSEQALAAYVERLNAPCEVFIENVDEVVEMLLSTGRAENILALARNLSRAATKMVEAFEEEPATSLARRDARMKAEALDSLADLWERDVTVTDDEGNYKGAVVTTTTDWVRERAAEYRHQAQGEDHE